MNQQHQKSFELYLKSTKIGQLPLTLDVEGNYVAATTRAAYEAFEYNLVERNQLLEQCAKLCDNLWDVDSAAQAIRQLKDNL